MSASILPYYATKVSKINESGYIGVDPAYVTWVTIRPVVYLNSNVKIEEDTKEDYGSSSNPYRLTTN